MKKTSSSRKVAPKRGNVSAIKQKRASASSKVKARQVATATNTQQKKTGVNTASIRRETVKQQASNSVAATVREAKAASPKTAARRGYRAQGLNAKQMRDLLERLQTLQSELKLAVKEKAGTFNAVGESESIIKGDDAEVAEKQRVSNAALQELDFIKLRLRLVERALQKVNEGSYGFCEETEEPIGYERLSVVPWARFAVHVQEQREAKLRDFKGSRLRSEA